MRARPSGSRAGRWGVVAVAAAACASAAWGDDDATSGSPSFTSKVRAIAGTAADTSSVNLRLRGTVAQATVGGAASAQSTNFRLAGGIAQVPPQLQTGQPLVFGLLALTGPNAGKPQSFGSAEGGDSA